MKISHLKKYKKSIFFILILIMILIYCLNEHFKKQIFFKKLDGSMNSIPTQPVFLKDLTNFDWDYAKILDTEDIQNIWFYKNDEIIFTDGVDLDSDGLFKSQVLFSPQAYCAYDKGKVVFDKKIKMNRGKDIIYYYKPVDCSTIPNSSA